MNILKFVVGSFCVFLVFCGLTVALGLNNPNNVLLLLFVFVVAPFFLVIYFVSQFALLFWPFILYFWAGIWIVRQRTLLTLVQTAAETKTPLAEMIHAYASGCYSSRFRARLERFAAILEQGHSLDEAISRDSGLFRYDIVSMLRLGGNDPATLRSMESSMSEDRDYSPIRSMSIVRVAYLFSIVGWLFLFVGFVMLKIVTAFHKIFLDFDISLPWLTRLVVDTSSYFVSYYWYLCSPLVWLAVILYILLLITQTGIIVLRPPLFRRMFREADSAKMLRILSVGLKQNLPISFILQVYRYAVPSAYLRRKAFRIENDVESGRLWTESLMRQRIVSAAEASLLETAGRTDNLSAVLHQLSGSKERSQHRKDDLASKLIFISCLLALAAVVGVIAIAMFLPVIKLTNALSH
ncbi:type II secretion system protein GspF [Planctomycetales bacterium]|nr:type II secretion system protein GspF [Planctomycetales bacterium]